MKGENGILVIVNKIKTRVAEFFQCLILYKKIKI